MDKANDPEVLSRGSQLTRGRKFDAAELQLLLLWLLQKEPGHGYALAQRLGELSHGYYAPSPGALYPALAQLEAQSLAQVQAVGRRRTYRIAPAGAARLEQRVGQAEALLAILRHAGRRMLWMRQAGQDETAAAAATGWLPEYVEARRALRAALLAHDEADHGDQRRVISILRRTVEELDHVLQGKNHTPSSHP
jgi:DNA-binding PadR family transcriptional regulator